MSKFKEGDRVLFGKLKGVFKHVDPCASYLAFIDLEGSPEGFTAKVNVGGLTEDYVPQPGDRVTFEGNGHTKNATVVVGTVLTPGSVCLYVDYEGTLCLSADRLKRV